jgi:hypothetical protein
MKTETKNKLIRTGGIFSGLFLILHVGFYWIFRWGQTLQVMNPTDKAILLTLNLAGILFLIYTSGVSFLLTKQLSQTTTGRSILLFFASFYLLRIAAEFLFFGFAMPKSIVAVLLCLIPAVCYLLAAIPKPENN